MMPWFVFRNMSDSDLGDVRTAMRRLWPFAHRVNNSEPPTHCPVCLQEHGGGDSNHAPVPPKGVALPRKQLAKYVGKYRAREGGQLVEVRFEGDHLMVGDAKQSDRLIPLGKGRFFGGLAPVQFEFDAQGRVTHMVEVEVDDYVYDRVPEPASE
jgi:hypothetical protein